MSNFVSNFFSSLFPKKENYLVYKSGRSNIILSAPHSGTIKPIYIPNRKYGNRSKDTYALELIQKTVELMMIKPNYIYSTIHRCKVDFNRDIIEGCQNNLEMEKLWNIWNDTLRNYSNEVRFFHKLGLYIDIHTHNNSDEFQIGYGIPVKDYLILLRDDKIPTKNSTMHTLKEFDPSYYKSEHGILFGEQSFPFSLEKSGYKVLLPKNDKYYLNGGRDIQQFHGEGIGALQIECPISVLRNDLDGVATALVNAIEVFSNKFLTKN